MQRFIYLLILLLFISACSSGASEAIPATLAPTATASAAPTATITLTPTSTPAPTETPTPTNTPSPTPFTPFAATAWADNVNVRANPGYLFAVTANVRQGTAFQVLGKSPGGEWIYAQAPSGNKGWVFAKLLESEQDLQAVPLIQPAEAQLVRGRVQDSEGGPVSGIQFAITQGSGPNAPRTDAMTDENGDFYAFMPTNVSGDWIVAYTAVACTSNTMDADCNCKGGICGDANPLTIKITLPWVETLLFTWK